VGHSGGGRSFDVVAGTAWLFSAEDAVGLVDWLFIDEAGQVCLANVVGVAPATRNIVMLGDQMQLEQPCQETHPEDSAKSCLEYYLQEHATIPPELGIFFGDDVSYAS
jgi:superfamily I DNA and/or RNA helicase